MRTATLNTVRPYILWCIKDGGARKEFTRYALRADAEKIAKRLSEIGCQCEIEDLSDDAGTGA